jgi:lipoprotein-anchoring transpeptidase ErfK/SrfK
MRRAALAPLLLVLLPASAAAAPTPSIDVSAARGPAPLTVRFTADAAVVDPAPAIASYAWSFGDGTTGSGQAVSHRYARAGRFAVGLTVTDSLGGTATATTQVEAQALALRIAPATVVFGRRAIARGALVPARAGTAVVLERRSAAGWTRIASARTDSAGRCNTRLRPGRTGVLRARVGALSSAALRLTVAPELKARAGAGVAFVGAPLVVLARPATAAALTVTVFRGGREVARTRGRPGARLIVPTPGVGAFAARIELAGGTLTVPVLATARTLSYGSTGPDVAALRARLAELHVHVPSPSTTFGSELADSVVAFQKARGLDRTGTVDETTWRALSQDVAPAPRYRGADTHIEVSKSRQILMIVRNGQTLWYLPISSGAGGITPVGNYRILWKALATTTWLGPAILYRTMTFHTNYAIHGFPSVPTYAASHGCVRVPIWIADWLYQQSPVGERVYVYQ